MKWTNRLVALVCAASIGGGWFLCDDLKGPEYESQIDSAYYNGYAEGYKDGHEIGVSDGYSEGYDDGYDDGYDNGKFVAKISGSSSSSTSKSSSSVSSSTKQNEATVYVTRTGGKYHKFGCQYLKESCIPLARTVAIYRGYDPCSRCY